MKSLIVRDFRRKFSGRLGSTSVTGFGIGVLAGCSSEALRSKIGVAGSEGRGVGAEDTGTE